MKSKTSKGELQRTQTTSAEHMDLIINEEKAKCMAPTPRGQNLTVDNFNIETVKNFTSGFFSDA